MIGDDGAHGAGKPGPLGPPRDLVAETRERLAGRLVDAALQVEAARMVGMRLDR